MSSAVPPQPSPAPGCVTFEEEVGVILEGAVGLLHEGKVGVLRAARAAGRAPGLGDELAAELEDQAEDAVDDVHDRRRLLGQQAPGGEAGAAVGAPEPGVHECRPQLT